MNDLRIAAQQALEAAENRLPLIGQAAIIDELNALRVALAQPNKDYERGFVDGMSEQARRSVDRAVNALEEQEPVARVLQTVGQYHTGRFVAEVETVRRLRDGENLYTAPPRREWASLTEEEIQTIVNKVATGTYQTSDTFARAVEQALKEKNHE